MRKEVPVRNYPGIYKRYKQDKKTGKWMETGKYRALRRVVVNGQSKKEQGVFDNFEDAKNFRLGRIEKTPTTTNVHRTQIAPAMGQYTFEALVEEWKGFHYLQLEETTQQGYNRRLRHLGFLYPAAVDAITTTVIDELVKYWVTKHPKTKFREDFDKELTLIKVILNFYRRRKNPAYVIPVLDDHYRAADLKRKAQQPVQSLSKKELSEFLGVLKDKRNPQHYVLALTQFCLGLRIGEACGLEWKHLDLENRVAVIQQTVIWDLETQLPKLKQRPKNGKVRALVIPEILASALKELKATRTGKDGLIFQYRGRPLVRKSVGAVYNRVLRDLGITHVSGTHMLRKTSATLANQATGDFYAVSKLLDHASPDVTLRYVAQTNASKQKVADALDGVLREAFGSA